MTYHLAPCSECWELCPTFIDASTGQRVVINHYRPSQARTCPGSRWPALP